MPIGVIDMVCPGVYFRSMSSKCGCVKHGEVCQSYPQMKLSYSKLKSRVHPKKIIDELIAQELISPRATFICSLCAKYALEEGPPTKRSKVEDQKLYSPEQFIQHIENNEFSADVLSKVAHALGKSQHVPFGQQISDVCCTYKDILTNNSTGNQQLSNGIIENFVHGVCFGQAETKRAKDCSADLILEGIACSPAE